MIAFRAVVVLIALVAVSHAPTSTAIAAPFQVEVFVGWINATGTCDGGFSSCLGFAGVGGFAGTSTQVNWDVQTAAPDSFLSVGVLPEVVPFGDPPTGAGTTTIDVGETLRIMQLRHLNNPLPSDDESLSSITLRTLLRILTPDGASEIIVAPLDIALTHIETLDAAPCGQPSDSTCDDLYALVVLAADLPFTFDSHDYVLQLRGLLDADGSPSCTIAEQGIAVCQTRESEISDRFTIIKLVQRDVPVPAPTPATLILLGLAVVGVRALRRPRRRRKPASYLSGDRDRLRPARTGRDGRQTIKSAS